MKKIYVDIKDLLEYVKHNVTYSGIQRVASEFLVYCFDNIPGEIIPVVLGISNNIKKYDQDTLKKIHDAVSSGSATREILNALLKELNQKEEVVYIEPDSVYFMIGAFWVDDNYKYIIPLKRLGVKFVLFVHDLIQIRNKEYVHTAANEKFLSSFTDVIYLVDMIIANSFYVANDVKLFIDEYLSNNLIASPEVVAVQLATEHREIKATAKDLMFIDNIELLSKPYVLCVGTMEIRKNNIYLVKVWERLIQLYGIKHVPNLVFCGKRGWNNEQFFQYIEMKRYCGSWLYLIESAPESLLSLLYENSLFTCFVSFAEGWGLPISESLAHGKLCVASNVTSMPEAGGDFCLYVNPYDIDSGFEVIKQLVEDQGLIKNKSDAIKISFQTKTWSDFSREILNHLKQASQISSSKVYCYIPPSKLALTGNADIRESFEQGLPLLSSKMAATTGWHQIEDWGVWACNKIASFECAADIEQGQIVTCYLKMKVPADTGNIPVSIICDGDIIKTFHVNSYPRWFIFDMIASSNRTLKFNILSNGNALLGDARGPIYVGVCGFAYSGFDIQSKVSLLQEIFNDGIELIQVSSTGYTTNDNPENKIKLDVEHIEVMSDAISELFSIIYEPTRHNVIKIILNYIYLNMARMFAGKRKWAQAAKYYIRIFKNGGATPKALVQFGHAINELGLNNAAFIAYAAAYQQKPTDDDVAFHYQLNLDRLLIRHSK